MIKNAGLLPAFVDYQLLSHGYQRLIDQFRAGKQLHAYLFIGPRGIGKRSYAKYLASILFCESDQKPCRTCDQCQLIYGGKHSSILEIYPKDNKAISVDCMRDVVSLTSMHSLDGRERVIIIEPIESLTPQAQNCILRSLEEPYTNVIYFFLSHDTSSLLDTIISRCFAQKLIPWSSEVLTQHLIQLGYPHDKVKRAIVFSGGNVGEALSIVSEQHDDSLETALQQILQVSNYSDVFRCSATLKDMAGYAEQILSLLERHLQQCIMIKSELISPEYLLKTPWSGRIDNTEIQDLIDLINQVFITRKLRMSNVNWQSNIDQLILKILEATRKWQIS